MMKTTGKVFCLLLIAVLFSGSTLAGTARNISADDAYKLLQEKGESLFLLDVRTPGEFRELRLDGAKLIPIGQLLKRVNEIPKDKALLVYCAVGSRSSQVVGYLARVGYPEVYNLYGGIYAWKRKGYPIITGLP